MRYLEQDPFFGVVTLCAMIQTPLPTSPMLTIKCPAPTSPFGPYLHPEYPPQPSTPTHVIYLS